MNADARNSPSGNSGWQQKRAAQWRAATIRCPELADRLTVVPRQARGEAERNLARLDSQVADAYRRMQSSRGVSDQRLPNNAVLRPLAEQRRATIDRIAASIGRWAERPQGLQRCAVCRAVPQPANGNGNGGNGNGGNDNGGNDNGEQGQDNQGQNSRGKGNNGQDNEGNNGGGDNGGGNGGNNGGEQGGGPSPRGLRGHHPGPAERE